MRVNLKCTARLIAPVLLHALCAAAFAQAVPDFAPVKVYPTGGGSSYIKAGDFNGDGIRDVVTVESLSSSVAVMLGQAGGGFAAPLISGVGSPMNSISVGDLNRDGITDVVLTTGTDLVILIGQTTGRFAPPVHVLLPIAPSFAAMTDFNKDGVPDLAATGTGGTYVAMGNGTGSFSPGSVMPQSISGFWLLVGDFNGDGNKDLLAQGTTFGLDYLGHGDGTFAAPLSTLNPTGSSYVGDFNHDGRTDFLYFSAQQRQNFSNQSINIAHAQPDGTFFQDVTYTFTNQSIGLPMPIDFNNDGFSDVACRKGADGTMILLQSPNLSTPTQDNLGVVPTGSLNALDVDGNGAEDLVILGPTTFTVFRNTHGNPALLAKVGLNPASVIGGSANSEGTVMLGAPAGAGGTVVEVVSSDPAHAFLPSGATVTIPAGATSATFPITSVAVAESTPVTISATAAGVTQTATLSVIPGYGLSSITANPASQYGIFTLPVTVTLSGPADSSAVVSLSSSNPAVALPPASITVPAGTTSTTANLVLSPVAVDTPATITASMGGVSRQVIITVLKPADAVTITKAQFTSRSFQLKVEATGTNPAATVTVYNAATGVLIGTLSANNGKYTGTFSSNPVSNITLKSTFGGTTTGAVEQK